jgi:hypothetical protein
MGRISFITYFSSRSGMPHTEIKTEHYPLPLHVTYVGIATGYGLDVPGIVSRWVRDFPHPPRPLGPPSLLYTWYLVFPAGKERPGRDADPPPPSSAVVMKG